MNEHNFESIRHFIYYYYHNSVSQAMQAAIDEKKKKRDEKFRQNQLQREVFEQEKKEKLRKVFLVSLNYPFVNLQLYYRKFPNVSMYFIYVCV